MSATRVGSSFSGRLDGLDSLRGLAIVLMVAANAGAEVLSHPHPVLFRLYGSFAAPIFVTLAGLMVGLSTTRDLARAGGPSRHLGYYLARAAFLFLIAMIIDLGIGGYLPAQTCDVLYLIALSLPLAYLVSRSNGVVRWLMPIAILSATPLVQSLFGYRLEISQPQIDTPLNEWPLLVPGAIHRFFVDGWFPLFPWLAYSCFGALLGTRWRADQKGLRIDLRLGLALLATGILSWVVLPGAMTERNGYTELFYPATVGFVLATSGAILCLIPIAERWSDSPLAWLLRPFGRCSLLLYIVHLLAIHEVWQPLADDLPMAQFLALYVGFLAILWLLAVGVDLLKHVCRETGLSLPTPIAVILGA